MQEVNGRIVWSGRVPRHKIWRLYESEARGLLDDELCDDVAWSIWERCSDILIATRAHMGEATCPRCRSIVRHGWRFDEQLACACGWTMTWRAYMQTYRRKQLHGGGSIPWVQEFFEALPNVKTPREQMLLIDRLINRWHWDLQHPEPNDKVAFPSRPTAVNVIGGTAGEILAFLDELAGITSSDPAFSENRRAYEANRDVSFAHWPR